MHKTFYGDTTGHLLVGDTTGHFAHFNKSQAVRRYSKYCKRWNAINDSILNNYLYVTV